MNTHIWLQIRAYKVYKTICCPKKFLTVLYPPCIEWTKGYKIAIRQNSVSLIKLNKKITKTLQKGTMQPAYQLDAETSHHPCNKGTKHTI